MADTVRVNGKQHSWASTIFRVNGERFYGISSISYGDKRERTKTYGMGRHQAPRGRTSGKYTVEALKLKVYTSTAQELRNLFAVETEDGASIGNAEVPIVLQLIEDDESNITVEFDRCAIASITASHDEGPDPASEEWELDVMLIRRNGQTLFDATQGSP
jgi:hypothetical protein